MTVEGHLLEEPWGTLLEERRPLSRSSQLDGSGSPRLVLEASDSAPSVVLPTGRADLPTASYPYVLGKTAYQAFHLPTDHREGKESDEFHVSVATKGGMTIVRQAGAIARPSESSESESRESTQGHVVGSWIDWQLWAFQELSRLPEDLTEFDAATRASVVRRTWAAAENVWFRDGSKEARTALIVRLSTDSQIHRALSAVSKQPRRILQRIRDNVSIGRIQEIDSACIRDYARRPGVTALEKAGPQQRLLAVRRHEQRDTLENRVACWAMKRLEQRAGVYCAENSRFQRDEKVVQVSRFGRGARIWRSSEPLRQIAQLRQVVTQPNYPLQFDPTYRIVWKTYQRLLKEKREIDDTWAWQRVLWGETGRQLLSICLHQLFRPEYVSTPFYRIDSRHGHWTEAPTAPGPFATPHGVCIVFDSRDLDDATGRTRNRWLEQPPFPGAEYVGGSGCDQVLLWPQLNRALLVWHLYHASLSRTQGGLPGLLDRCGTSLNTLSSDMRRFAHSRLRLSGLVLVADLERRAVEEGANERTTVQLEPGTKLSDGGAMNALCVPPDVEAWPRFSRDFCVGVGLVVEELLR